MPLKFACNSRVFSCQGPYFDCINQKGKKKVFEEKGLTSIYIGKYILADT